MGLLDDAIREHLDLMRRHGANEAEVARREAEALGPVLREEDDVQESGSAPVAADAEPSLPYDRAAEAGLTGEPDLPSFEWHGSSTAEPDVPSFVSPEPLGGTDPEPDGVEPRADAEVAPGSTEAFDVVEVDPAVEEPDVSVEPDVPEPEGTLQEERAAELDLSPEPPVMPEPSEEAAAYEPVGAPEAPAEPPFPEEEPIEGPVPTDAEDGFAEQPPHEAEQPPLEAEAPPLEAAPPPPEPVVEQAASFEEEPPLTADTPLEDATAFWPAPIEDDLPPSSDPDPFESVPRLGTEAAEEPALPADFEDLPPEPEPVPAGGGPSPFGAEDLPPEQAPPPPTAGQVVEEPRVEEPLERPLEEPFVAGEEEAWREAGEAPGDVSGSLPEPPLGGASSSEELDPYPARPVEADAPSEPADEGPLDERPLRPPTADAELPSAEPLDASLGEPLDTPDEPADPLPADSETARGFFDETAEHERPAREERSHTVDPDFED